MKKFYIILIGLFLCFLWMAISTGILYTLAGMGGIYTEEGETIYYTFFITCIWAPIWEEMMYRWAPIQIAKRTDSKKYLLPVIIIASATFGWGHGDSQEGVFIQGVLGLIFSWVYVYTDRIWCSMLIHCLYNSTLFFLPLLTNS